MKTLEVSLYPRVRPLLTDLMPFNGSIAGVLEGNNPGTIYVDEPDAPQVILMISPEGIYVAGETPSPDRVATLKKHITHLMMHDGVEAMWLICSSAWQAVVDDFLPRPPFPIDRLYYACTAVTFDWRAHVPDGFAVQAIDQALLARADLTIPEHIHGWIANNWGTPEDFFARGFGFVTEALNAHEVVSWSLCDCVGDNACEIGIQTHPDYRQRGLAALTAAAAVDYALAHGLSRVGWHCRADNIGSQRTASRAGFTREREYLSFASFRREAIHWAEAGRLQEVAGEYHAAAEYYMRADACDDKPEWGAYIPFYAACAFARHGDYDSAWKWLHRAVDQGFDDGDALQSVDALTPMQSSPEWDALRQAMA